MHWLWPNWKPTADCRLSWPSGCLVAHVCQESVCQNLELQLLDLKKLFYIHCTICLGRLGCKQQLDSLKASGLSYLFYPYLVWHWMHTRLIWETEPSFMCLLTVPSFFVCAKKSFCFLVCSIAVSMATVERYLQQLSWDIALLLC